MSQHILISCEQVEKIICSDSEFNILRSVYIDKQISHFEFKNIYYFRLIQYNIEYLHIYLTNENGENIAEMGCHVKCVLHCRKIKL